MTEDERYQQIKDEIGWHCTPGDVIGIALFIVAMLLVIAFSS